MAALSNGQSTSWLDYISLGGCASLGVSFIFFQFAGHHDGRISLLDRAQALDTLASACRYEHMLPLLVAVRGRMTCREPSKCELSGAPAVMRELLEEEVYFKEHTSGRVTQESFEIRREQEQREAFLEDLSGSLKVDNLQHAAGLPGVMAVKQLFRPVDLLQGTLLQAVINKAFKSMVKHGVRSTERYLPVDTTVTIIGELAADSVGSAAAASSGSGSSSSGNGHGNGHNHQQRNGATSGSGRGGAPPPSSSSASSAWPSAPSSSSSVKGDAGARSPSGAAVSTYGRPPTSSSAAAGEGGGAAGGGTSRTSPSGAAAALSAELLGQAAVAGAGAAVRALPYTLRMPSNGPFHVTALTLPQLRAAMERTSKTLRVFAWGFGVLGAALVVRKVAVQLWRLREHRRLKRMLAEAAAVRRQRAAQRAAEAAEAGGGVGAAGAGAGVMAAGVGCAGAGGDDGDDGDVRSPGTCVVCMDRDADVVFTGCGHLCACFGCSPNLSRCPICRVNSRMLRVYRP